MMGLKYWDEYVKRNFNDEDQELPVPFPGLVDNEEAGVEGGFLVLTKENVREIFEPIIKEVVELVEGQLETIRRKGGKVAVCTFSYTHWKCETENTRVLCLLAASDSRIIFTIG